MPDGSTHDLAWKYGRVLALPLSIASAWVTDPLPLYYFCNSRWCISGQTVVAMGVLLGYVYGRYITPDEDIVGMSVGEGLMMNHFPIIGSAFVAYWTFYGAIFRKYHRSMWTHGPIISTAVRYIYAFWWMALLIWKKGWWQEWVMYTMMGAFIGTCLIDIIHWWLDLRSGELRR